MASDTEELVLSISADTRQIMNAIKRLEKDISASAAGVQKSFSEIGRGIDKSIDTTVQRRINEITGIGVKATKEWTGALAEQGKELERMRARFNPIFSVVSRYKSTVLEIQAAQRLGAISTDEMTAAIQRERQAALSSIAALKQRNAALDRGRGGSNFNTANIAAQFQDIGVTAAMGMSPLQIALQQGTQLSAVLNGMGSARNVVAGLGAAFSSIISPVSLVTIGVVGLTAAAVQYFSTFLGGAEDSEEALKAQAELIQKVAERWGDALPSIKAYADQQRRLVEQADIQGATAGVVANAWEAARKGIEEARGDVANIIDLLGNMPEQQNSVVALQRAFNALSTEVAAGKTEAESLERVSRALTELYDTFQVPIVNDLADAFAELAANIAKADQAATIAKAEEALKNIAASLPALGTVSPVFSGNGKFIDANDVQTARANAKKSQYQLEQERLSKKATKSSPRTADDRFFEDIEAIRQRTAALAQEYAMLGSTFEAQAKRKVAFELEQKALKDVREEARRKGDQDWQNAQLSPDQVRAIDQVSTAYAQQAEQLRKAQEVMGFQRDVLKGMLSDFRSAFADGKIDAQEWGGIVIDVLDKVIDRIENQLLDAIFETNDAWAGMRSTGGGSGIFAFIGQLFSGLFRASGGPVKKGQPYIVGEKRPELFVPNQSGTIVPRVPEMPAIGRGGRGAGGAAYIDNRTINIDARGAQQGVGEEIRRALQEYDREVLPRRVNAIANDPYAVG